MPELSVFASARQTAPPEIEALSTYPLTKSEHTAKSDPEPIINTNSSDQLQNLIDSSSFQDEIECV